MKLEWNETWRRRALEAASNLASEAALLAQALERLAPETEIEPDGFPPPRVNREEVRRWLTGLFGTWGVGDLARLFEAKFRVAGERQRHAERVAVFAPDLCKCGAHGLKGCEECKSTPGMWWLVPEIKPSPEPE